MSHFGLCCNAWPPLKRSKYTYSMDEKENNRGRPNRKPSRESRRLDSPGGSSGQRSSKRTKAPRKRPHGKVRKNGGVERALIASLQSEQGRCDALEEKLCSLAVESDRSVDTTVSSVIADKEVLFPSAPVAITEHDVHPSELIGAHCELHFRSDRTDKCVNRAMVRMPIWLEKQGQSLPKDRVGMKRILDYIESFSVSPAVPYRYDWWRLVLRVIGMGTLGMGLRVVKKPLFKGLWAGGLMGFAAVSWFVSTRRVRNVNDGLLVSECKKLTDYCTGFLSESRRFVMKWMSAQQRKFGNWLHLPTWTNFTKCEEHEFLVGYTILPNEIWCARSCIHNELKALCSRQLLEPKSTVGVRTVVWDYNRVALLEQFSFASGAHMCESQEMLDDFIKHYPDSRKRMILQGFEEVNSAFHVVTGKSKVMVKVEWNVGKALNKRDPRCISGKEDDYLAATGPLYYSYMKSLVAQKWPDVTTALRQKYIYTGGMTSDQIGLIISHYETMGWCFYEGDFSRYDGRTELEALRAEFACYDLPGVYKDYLLLQLESSGVSRGGVKFHQRGKRASGVINTSFGNTVVGFMFFAGCFKRMNFDDFVVVQLGDDNVVMTRIPIDLQFVRNYANDCGHVLEIKEVVDVDYLEFCSMRFWDVGGVRVLGPKPGRVLAKTFVSVDPLMQDNQLCDYVLQIAKSFQYYQFVPVLGEFCRGILEHVVTDKKYKSSFRKYGWTPLREEIEVDNVSVANQFLKIYGFSPESLCQDLRSFDFKVGVALESDLLYHMARVDGAW